MDVICNMLAKMIVNFETIEEIEDANMRRVRAKYVKYSDIVSQLAEVDVRVRLEDNLQKLIGHIQEERSRVKLINLFVSQSKLSSGTHSCDYEPYVEACFGDGSFSEIPKLGESNDGPVQQKSFEWELKESVGEMGSEGGINGGERDQNQNQKKVDDCDTGEGLGDDSLVLYGMIRCSWAVLYVFIWLKNIKFRWNYMYMKLTDYFILHFHI